MAESSNDKPAVTMDEIVALCRRRGFIFQSSEIYGGINGFWDYGPMGVLLKKNLKDAWWQDVIACPPNGPDGKPLEMVGLDSTIIMNPKVWEASGHLAGFNDPMVDCRETNARYRADHLFVVMGARGSERIGVAVPAANEAESQRALESLQTSKKLPSEFRELGSYKTVSQLGGVAWTKDYSFTQLSETDRKLVIGPDATKPGTLTEPRQFNLMFETYIGAVRDEDAKAYLRPETAQGIFVNFRNIVDTSRVKVPFGIAQIGKAFRNEVTPRNFTFRSREFEQMEIEFFIHESEAAQWYAYWRDARYAWWQSVGLAGDNLTLREHDADELAHYAKEGAGTSDVEYRFPFTAPGFGELEGVAHRTNYDLRQHAEHSGLGDKFKYFDQERGEKYFPHVIEPSAGADRGTLALLCEAYTPDPDRPSGVYMKFTPRMAPIKAGIFPLVNKGGMPGMAEKLHRELRPHFAVEFDAKQSIGKRYARMDEIGTPYCFTIDGDSLEDNTVTVRERDTQAQHRIGIDKVHDFLVEKVGR